MRTQLDCYTCFIKQIVNTVGLLWKGEEKAESIVREVLLSLACELADDERKMSAIEIAGRIQRIIRDMLGSDDPYENVKWMSNDLVMKWYPALKRRIAQSATPFETAVRMAIAGNIIDFGLNGNLYPSEIESKLETSMTAPIDHDQLRRLQESVLSAKRIFYVTDNAGEIVFDKLLVEQLPLDKVIVGVRGRAVLNDATMKDAEQIGLTNMVRVIDSGTDIPGTVLERCSPEFQKHMNNADLIISKGQGNFESLDESGLPVFFLFLIKCPVAARHLELPEQSFVIRSAPGV